MRSGPRKFEHGPRSPTRPPLRIGPGGKQRLGQHLSSGRASTVLASVQPEKEKGPFSAVCKGNSWPVYFQLLERRKVEFPMANNILDNSPVGHLLPIRDNQKAFVPASLPRRLRMSSGLVYRLDEASRVVGELVGVGETIANPNLLIRPFLRKEAVLSSRIEGTQASLSDLFMYEATGMRRPRGDVREVMNYIRALEHGMALLGDLPICLRLVNEVHGVLLDEVRGQEKTPGQLRKDIVWIGSEGTALGEARYVPPPAEMVRDLMEDWERFANEKSDLPPLIKCGLLHYQIEAIHPYRDGNGRVGRLLITLYLHWKNVLPKPLLYLSAYFERQRSQYYDQLFNVSATGDWEKWLHYFLTGVIEQARDALLRTRRIRELQEVYRHRLQECHESGNAFKLVDELFMSPVMSATEAAKILGVTRAGARGVLTRLGHCGIVERIEEAWPRLYVARELLSVIEATEKPAGAGPSAHGVTGGT